MNLEVKKLDTANAQVSAKPSTQDMQKRYEKFAQKVAKNAKIDGFRRGKVPLSLIKSRYQANIEQDAQEEMVQEILKDALKELGVESKDLIGSPHITKFEKKDDCFEVEMSVGLKPTIVLDKIKDCAPSFKVEAVAEEMVQERLKKLAKDYAKLVDAKENKEAQHDDVVTIDFEGFIDNEPFEGGKAENFSFTLGSKQMLEEFEKAVLNMKVGEEKEFPLNFPTDYHANHLAGKEARFKVKLHKIQVRDIPEINDEFAKNVLAQEENATLATLQDRVKGQLFVENKTKLYNEELKEKFIESLDEKISFDLPKTIVEQEMDLLFRNALYSMEEEEVKTLQEDQEKAKEKRESFRKDATKSVKVTFIVDALAKQEEIFVHDNEVFQTLYYEAMMTGQNPQALIEQYRQNNMLPAVKMAMIEDRVLTHFLDQQLSKEEQEMIQSLKPTSKNTK
ncbi:trigger factor [Helicobacter cetorum]|uniref:trigger factor n=1 Tax=Helicobacter cetorum TaxID=138563 RepID=UPI000CF031FC|nr:trigger factor [Helicobacter cetorum]